MPEKFILDTDEGSFECRILTSLYHEGRKKHYLVYEYVDNSNDDIYVSEYDPDSEEDDYILNDVSDPQELEEVSKLVEEFMEQ